jgi:uncharacterized protein
MFARILLWLLVGLAAWWLLRPRRKITPPGDAVRPPAAPGAAPEAMVDCASCGLHFPASEALLDGAARTYCCAAHRDAGPRRGE